MANLPQDRSLQVSPHLPMSVLAILGPVWFDVGGVKPRDMVWFSPF